MTTFPQCGHRGRLIGDARCFCRHAAVCGLNAKSRPVTLAQCLACPIPTGGELPQRSTAQLTGGPGTELVNIFKRLKVPACQQCRDLAAKMDAWGVDGCRERLEEIVADILPRAREWASKGWFTRMAPDAALSAVIRSRVQRAIREASPK